MVTPRKFRICGAALATSGFALFLAGFPLTSGQASPFEPPMQVHIVRQVHDGCKPNCPEWIAAQGQIVIGTLKQFEKILTELDRPKLPVLIDSGGGVVSEAMAIGRMLRMKRLDIGVAKTELLSCPPDAEDCGRLRSGQTLQGRIAPGQAMCASSCAFILAAGIRRFVGQRAVVGVHRGELLEKKVLHIYREVHYRAGDGSIQYKQILVSQTTLLERSAEMPQGTLRRFQSYFREMGIGDGIMRLVSLTPNSNIHWLAGDELDATRLATHRMNAEDFIQDVFQTDEWRTSDPLTTPMMPATERAASDCMLNGSDCVVSFDPAPSNDAEDKILIGSTMTGPDLVPSAAEKCVRTGEGCSWELAPRAPTTSSTGLAFR